MDAYSGRTSQTVSTRDRHRPRIQSLSLIYATPCPRQAVPVVEHRRSLLQRPLRCSTHPAHAPHPAPHTGVSIPCARRRRRPRHVHIYPPSTPPPRPSTGTVSIRAPSVALSTPASLPPPPRGTFSPSHTGQGRSVHFIVIAAVAPRPLWIGSAVLHAIHQLALMRLNDDSRGMRLLCRRQRTGELLHHDGRRAALGRTGHRLGRARHGG